MLEPHLVVVTERLFDLRFSLRVEDRRLTFPLLTHTCSLGSCLTHVFLILIDIIIHQVQILIGIDLQGNEQQHIRDDDHTRIRERTIIIMAQEGERNENDSDTQTDPNEFVTLGDTRLNSMNRLLTRHLTNHFETVTCIEPVPNQEERNQGPSDQDEEDSIKYKFDHISIVFIRLIYAYFKICCKVTTFLRKTQYF